MIKFFKKIFKFFKKIWKLDWNVNKYTLIAFIIITILLMLYIRDATSPNDLFSTLLPYYLLFYFYLLALLKKCLTGNPEKKCAWCNSKKIKFKSGEKGNFYWEYRNNDGSQDKRIKDNVQKASFFSTYVCEECNAITNFYHLVDKDPSQSVEIHERILKKNGTGERKGSNWIDTSTITVDTKSPNRKGD